MKANICWIVLFLLASPAAFSQETTGEGAAQVSIDAGAGIVATVNGEPIYFEDLERRLGDLHGAVGETRRSGYDLDQLMFRLINDALLAQEARTLGMQDEDPVPERIEQRRLDLALKHLDKEEITSRAKASDEEIRQAFAQEYRRVSFRMVTLHERAEAEELLARIRKEEQPDFAALAREHSVDQYAARGGLLKSIPQVDLPPELADAAFGLAPGEIAGPIATGIGWASIQVEGFEDPGPEELEKRRGALRQMLGYRKAEALRAALSLRLQGIHPVSVDQEAVDAVDCKSLSDGRLAANVEDPDVVVARVGDRTITAQRLGQALTSRWKGVRNRDAALAAKPIVLERLIRGELMAAEALRRGYGDTPEAHRALRAYETQLLVPRFLSAVIARNIKIEEEEKRQYYEEHLEDFRKPPRVHAGQITVAEKEEAERLAELLRQGTDLAWLARKHSIDRFKDGGGDRGWVVPTPGTDPFSDGLFEAKPGDIVGPLGVPGNFIVLRVDAREDQGTYSFEQAAARIRSILFAEAFQVALDDVIQKLRSLAEIEIDQAAIASIRITGAPAEEEEAPPGHGHR